MAISESLRRAWETTSQAKLRELLKTPWMVDPTVVELALRGHESVAAELADDSNEPATLDWLCRLPAWKRSGVTKEAFLQTKVPISGFSLSLHYPTNKLFANGMLISANPTRGLIRTLEVAMGHEARP